MRWTKRALDQFPSSPDLAEAGSTLRSAYGAAASVTTSGPDARAGHHCPRRRLVPVAIAVVGLVAALSGGAAFAYFTGHGSGPGHATTGSAVTVTISTASGTPDLHPGASGTIYFTLNNTGNPLGVSFKKVTALTVTGPTSGGCIGTSYLTVPTTFPVSITPVSVGPNTSTTASIPGLVTLSASAPNACQGVTFTYSISLLGTE